MSIPPEDKDWTWVLQRPCSECGYDAAAVEPTAVGARVRASLPLWQQALTRPDAGVRPDPQVWSALEYGCHLRDVVRLFDERLRLILAQDDPQFADWNPDTAALEGRYGEQDPAAVARSLSSAGHALADRFDAVPDDAWARPGRRSDGAAFTVGSLGRYFLHEVEHHLHDARPR